MITFHLPLAEDEHYYSYFVALFQRSAWFDPKKFLNAMANNAGVCAQRTTCSAISFKLFPNELRGLIGTVMNIEQFRPDTLNILTLLPYYRPFLLPVQRQNIFKEAAFSIKDNRKRNGNLPQENRKIFRYCMLCMKESYKEYGRAVLLRAHQLPCVYVCWRHRDPLRKIEIDVDSLALPDFTSFGNKCLTRTSDEWLWIANESRKLLHLNRGFTNPPEKIHTLYLEQELCWDVKRYDKYFLCVDGADARDLEKSWSVDWSKKVVETCGVELGCYSDQLRRQYHSPVSRQFKLVRSCHIGSPIEHLLRSRRFEEGVTGFFKKLDAVSLIKINAFFFEVEDKPVEEPIHLGIMVTYRVKKIIEFLTECHGGDRKSAIDSVLDHYRDGENKSNDTDEPYLSTGSQISEPMGVRVSIRMRLQNFLFVDRLASLKGCGSFSMMLCRLFEDAEVRHIRHFR